MIDTKIFKDPIYGYIDIPTEYLLRIIDTAPFQRLRRIIQTSYSPLYSSAVHNRFVHSLGVFFLGSMASSALLEEIKRKSYTIPGAERFCEIFNLACLLHDVGHAPFSHTGEKYFLQDSTVGNEYCFLHDKLTGIIGSKSFESEITKVKAAKPHEIMSAIVGLSEYACLFRSSVEKEFFARCITGYQYSSADMNTSFLNCLITLLNSNIIDVDKLDYIIRDAYITGYDTVIIDFERLLNSLTLTKEGKYKLAYHKGAISVIENVVYAHDAERKWIQNHPVVLYECYLLEHILSTLRSNMDSSEHKLFSVESLSLQGHDFVNGIHISLLSDDDVIFLMKNVFPTDLGKEYLDRNARRHPLWKSEAEYRALFYGPIRAGRVFDNFNEAMDLTATYVEKYSETIINDDSISKLEKDLADLLANPASFDEETFTVQWQEKTKILKIMKCIKDYANKYAQPCDFVLIKTSPFVSGFSKNDFSKIPIVFSSYGGELASEFGNVVSSFDTKEPSFKDFFYLYYKRQNDTFSKNKEELCKCLLTIFL